MTAIKKVIGYSNLFDFYDIKDTLGKGKFGLVKSAIHKKTGKGVAVKIMSKKEMTVSDIELQRREKVRDPRVLHNGEVRSPAPRPSALRHPRWWFSFALVPGTKAKPDPDTGDSRGGSTLHWCLAPKQS
jgi:serine/threonine protein kinase